MSIPGALLIPGKALKQMRWAICMASAQRAAAKPSVERLKGLLA